MAQLNYIGQCAAPARRAKALSPSGRTFPSGSDRRFVSEFALPVSTPLGLLARILSLAVNLEALSPRPKIPFLADKAWRRHEAFAAQALNAGGVGKAGVLGRALLLRIQPERFELPTPFRRSIDSRSILMPRGKRPSTAARTSLGARKASEMVMLT
jgi:hypothetical protein